jgi:hypothetical protein
MPNITSLPLFLYGFIYSDQTGAVIYKSPNMTVTKSATGIFVVVPSVAVPIAFPTVTPLGGFAGAIIALASPGAAPSGRGWTINLYDATGVPADCPFYFKLENAGQDLSTVPAY